MFSNTFIKYFLLLISIIGNNHVYSNVFRPYKDRIIDKKVLYFSTHPQNEPLLQPFINLNSQEKIQICFDYKGEYKDFNYKIIHCNSDWSKSDLDEFEYIDGFIDNQITDYENSFNTNINYCHYKLNIPNQDVNLKKSGNYKLIIFDSYNEKDTVLIASFSLIEPLVDIKGRVRTATRPEFINTSQEIDFDIDHTRLKLFNAATDLKVYIWQNGDYLRRRKLKPAFIRSNIISYDYNDINVFKGGNEFRNFNSQNLKYLTRYIKDVEYDNDEIIVNLFPDYNRFYKPYIYERDINGNYVISAENKTDPNIEADYTKVFFTLAMANPLDKEIYVFGKLSNWNIEERFKMKYNLQIRAYTLNKLLKQGYYNYKYVVFDTKTKEIDKTFLEGSHYETENDYFVAVFYRDISKNYDRLVGYKRFNSSNVRTRDSY